MADLLNAQRILGIGLAQGSGIGWHPGLAVGTNYVPRDMLAQIHEGEAIIPKAYNPAANTSMGGGNSEVA